jgi:hypothetical protein
MRCLHHVPGEAMMSLMSGALGTHEHAPEAEGPQGTWWFQSPSTPGGGSGATGHVALSESYRAVVLVPRTHGDARAFLHRRLAWSRETRGDSGALPCRVAEPELSGIGSGCGAVRTRGDTGALSYRVQSLALWGWIFKSCAQGYPVCRVPTHVYGILRV